MTGLVRRTVSPSSSIMSRSTPWVDGCCGPMLMIMVSSSSSTSSQHRGVGLGQAQHRPDLAQHLVAAGDLPRQELLGALGGEVADSLVDDGHGRTSC